MNLLRYMLPDNIIKNNIVKILPENQDFAPICNYFIYDIYKYRMREDANPPIMTKQICAKKIYSFYGNRMIIFMKFAILIIPTFPQDSLLYYNKN